MSGKALVAACKAGDVEAAQRLLSLGADVDGRLLVDTVQRMLSLGADVDYSANENPLYVAAQNGHTAVVELLLKAGADMNKENPLYVAAHNGHTAVVEVLLKAGANVNKKLRGHIHGHEIKHTPLHGACRNGHHEVVAVLFSYNADGTIKDHNGNTALDLLAQNYKEDIAPLFSKKPAVSVTNVIEQWQKRLSAADQKLLMAIKWASISEERAAIAERRALLAEESTRVAEETASVSMKTATNAEERSVAAEKRAIVAEEERMASEYIATAYEERIISAETRAALAEERATAAEQQTIAARGKLVTFEQRAIVAEKECALSKQRYSEVLKLGAAEERAVTAEKRAVIAEERASVANKSAKAAEQRANVAEERAAVAEKRASAAEERVNVAEMATTVAEKNATNAIAEATTFKERTRIAENAVNVLQESARISHNRIAELGQNNATLERRAVRAELAVRDMTSKCRHLQEQIDKAFTPSWVGKKEDSVPSWVIRKEDIVLTDKELGRGGWGVVKAAKFCGLDVAAKFLHGAILSPHNQQLFKREMNIAAMVRHPNILLLIGATMDQECVILTELMLTSLREVLEEMEMNKSTMSHQQVFNIAMDVSKALNYLHLMKPDAIIHRDVSSGNVLLEQLGENMWKAKLSDFGSSNFARQITTAGPGSYSYAAPESSDPEQQSPKMDVFSYGILLLEMSCSQFPDVQKRHELIQKLTWSTMKPVIVECTAKEPKSRPSMADVIYKLNFVTYTSEMQN